MKSSLSRFRNRHDGIFYGHVIAVTGEWKSAAGDHEIFCPSSDLNRAETESQPILDKGILHGGDTLDTAREAKLESLKAQSSSADERYQNTAQKDLNAIKTLFSDLYEEKLGRPSLEAQIGFHLSE